VNLAIQNAPSRSVPEPTINWKPPEDRPGGSPCIAYKSLQSGFVPVGMSSGNMHVQFEFNLDNNSGVLHWHDIGDPTDPNTSGVDVISSFSNVPATYHLRGIWTAATGGANSKVFDNVYLGTAPLLKPTSLVLFVLGGLMMTTACRPVSVDQRDELDIVTNQWAPELRSLFVHSDHE